MATNSLKKSAKCDIWYLNLSNVYLDFTPSSPSHMVKYSKQNMTDTLSMTSWLVLENHEGNYSLNSLCTIENPCILKVSQRQYTFVMRFLDEIGLFLDVLTRNKNQMHLIKEKLSLKDSPIDIKMTIFLTIPTTLTFAIIDHFQDPVVPLRTPTQSNLSDEQNFESPMPNISDGNVESQMETTLSSNLINSMTFEKPVINKNLDLSGQKKSRIGGGIQRGLDMISKLKHNTSIPSSLNISENSDETSSQWDMSEDLDACLDGSFLNCSFEEQNKKSARIELDDDSIQFIGNNDFGLKKSELIDGIFIKLNKINLCIAQDNEQSSKPMFILCNWKYFRVDEFFSLEFDEIKPKLFGKENPDISNNENVPPIDARIDFSQSESAPSLSITVSLKDRILTIPSHAIDVISQNLQELDETQTRIQNNNLSCDVLPIDARLNNVQIILQPYQELSTIELIGEKKPLIEMMIEYMHIQRRADGKVIIRKTNNNDDEKQTVPSLPQPSATNNCDEKITPLEQLLLENERLRSELDAYKTEANALRGERDSLMYIISNFGNEFTTTENKQPSEEQQRKGND